MTPEYVPHVPKVGLHQLPGQSASTRQPFCEQWLPVPPDVPHMQTAPAWQFSSVKQASYVQYWPARPKMQRPLAPAVQSALVMQVRGGGGGVPEPPVPGGTMPLKPPVVGAGIPPETPPVPGAGKGTGCAGGVPQLTALGRCLSGSRMVTPPAPPV